MPTSTGKRKPDGPPPAAPDAASKKAKPIVNMDLDPGEKPLLGSLQDGTAGVFDLKQYFIDNFNVFQNIPSAEKLPTTKAELIDLYIRVRGRLEDVFQSYYDSKMTKDCYILPVSPTHPQRKALTKGQAVALREAMGGPSALGEVTESADGTAATDGAADTFRQETDGDSDTEGNNNNDDDAEENNEDEAEETGDTAAASANNNNNQIVIGTLSADHVAGESSDSDDSDCTILVSASAKTKVDP